MKRGALSWSIARRRTFLFAFAAKRDQIARRRTFEFAFSVKRHQIDDVDPENSMVPSCKEQNSTLRICATANKIVDRIKNLKRHPVIKRFFLTYSHPSCNSVYK